MVKISEREDVVRMLRGDRVMDINVRIWEPEGSEKSLLCVHGFAGTSWDFSFLARSMVKSGFTVIAPDMPGRGRSSFLHDPRSYNLMIFINTLASMAQFEKRQKFHLGTSWGGVVLMAYLASRGWDSRGIVLNDTFVETGETITRFRERITEEVTKIFSDREAAADFVLENRNLSFLEGAAREAYVESMVMPIGDGWRVRYDPALTGFFDRKANYSLVTTLTELRVPTMMLYGKSSPYATSPQLPRLEATNPNLTIVNDLDDGHPPSLMKTAQALQIGGFLAQSSMSSA